MLLQSWPIESSVWTYALVHVDGVLAGDNVRNGGALRLAGRLLGLGRHFCGKKGDQSGCRGAVKRTGLAARSTTEDLGVQGKEGEVVFLGCLWRTCGSSREI